MRLSSDTYKVKSFKITNLLLQVWRLEARTFWGIQDVTRDDVYLNRVQIIPAFYILETLKKKSNWCSGVTRRS